MFFASVQTDPDVQPSSYTTGTGSLSWRVMRPGIGFDHPLQPNAKVKERVAL